MTGNKGKGAAQAEQEGRKETGHKKATTIIICRREEP